MKEEEVSSTKPCASCGEEHGTPYCPNCGERRLTQKDFSILFLFQELTRDFLNIENKFWNTLKTYLTAPHSYLDQYLAGARKRLISPIKIFLLANAFYFVFPVMNTFKTTLFTQLNGLPYSEFVSQWVQGLIDNSGMTYANFEQLFNESTAIISKLFLVILPFIFGTLTYLMYRNQKPIKPLLHHFNFGFAFFAFLIFFGASVIPGIVILIANIFDSGYLFPLLNELIITSFIFVLMNAFGFFLYKRFLSDKWYHTVWKVLLLNLSFLPLLQLYRFILLWLTLGWIWVSS